jgi:hypothetical protein
MSVDSALIKILESNGSDLNAFLSTFPTQLLLRVVSVKGTTGGATGNIEYIMYGLPSASKSDPVWLIKKFIYDVAGFQTDSLFANGEAKFNKVADNYNGYTYSTS